MMTREEIDRHIAGILRLRARRFRQAKARALWDFNPNRRRVLALNIAGADTADISPVDTTFEARRRDGWLPRIGGRD